MNTRPLTIALAGVTAVAAIAYLVVSSRVEAAGGGVSVYAQGRNGLPAPVGLENGDRLKVSAIGPDGGPVPIHESGYSGRTSDCLEVTASTAGDGGVLTPTVGGRYVLTVNGWVRLSNGIACGSYASGVGRLIPEGSVLDWTAVAAPDGGAPSYRPCAETSGTKVQLCPQ